MNLLIALSGLFLAAGTAYWFGRRSERKKARPVIARARALEAFASALQTSTEQERATIARELHDQLGGVFVTSKMDVELIRRRSSAEDPVVAARLAQLSASLDAGLAFKRQLVERLHPSVLDHLGLFAALQWRLSEMCQAVGRECTPRVPEGDPGFAPDAAIAVYRIVENVVSHALTSPETSLVELDVSVRGDELWLAITDDSGSAERTPTRSHADEWLLLLTHRVEALGGQCMHERRPDGGIRISIGVPMHRMHAPGLG